MDKWTKLFGLVLSWREWLQPDTLTEEEVTQSLAGHQKLMKLIVSTASRGQ